MTPTGTLAAALGHVRNATWQLIGNSRSDGLPLGLECLNVEALLNPDDIDPEVLPPERDPAASLDAARALLDQIPDEIAPAVWGALGSLRSKLG